LLERETGPAHKICGEFLSGEALADLAELGIDTAALGAAPITAMRLVHRGRIADSRLPFAAAGLSRHVLDEALLQHAGQLGADVRRGVRVRSVEAGSVTTDAGRLDAPTLLLATGKHDLRGAPRAMRAQPDALIGFKMHFRLRPEQEAALAGHVEVVLFRGGYAGLQCVEEGLANLCLLVDRSEYDESWPALLASLERQEPHLARRLDGASPCWARPISIFRVPYGFVHQGPEQAGVYRLGDQAAVIPSFCGDGMAIALHSARLAADAVLAGQDAVAYHRAMRRDAGPPVRLAFGLYRLSRPAVVRSALVAAARAWPGLLRSVARRTRVSAATQSSTAYGEGGGEADGGGARTVRAPGPLHYAAQGRPPS
jgi:flavin-dependent dehydrogenase